MPTLFHRLDAIRAVQCSLGITDRGRHITSSSPDRNTWMYKCPILPTPNPEPVSIVDRDGVSIYGFTNIRRTTRSGRNGLSWTTTDQYLVFPRAVGMFPTPPATRFLYRGLGLRYDLQFSLRTATLPIVASIIRILLFANTRRTRALFFFLSHRS